MVAPADVPVHIAICVCTFKRPHLLERLLRELGRQATGDRLTFSVVVVDNDRGESAREAVAACQAQAPFPVVYRVEPEQNIARARNRALASATGDYVAFIDDDEFPDPQWLLTMLEACERHGASGVLGPVRPHFEQPPPPWIVRGRFCERREWETGCLLPWRETRTGNVLMRRGVVEGEAEPFRPQFGNGGEDQDFFRRMMEAGHQFIWCNEGVVHEVVPPERWTRRYMLRRALLRGQNEKLLLTAGSVARSLVAVPAYALLIPFMLPFGQHRFMKYCIKLMDHAGKLMAAVGLRPMGGKYLAT